MLTVWIIVLILVGIAIIAFLFVRMGSRAVSGAKALSEDAKARLDKAKPKSEVLRGEMTSGEKSNPETALGAGGLALYKDELVFVRTAGGEAWRLKLADMTDVTEIRAISALDMAEDVVDTAPDYLIKMTWTGGSAAFAVKDATAWISAIAGARM